MIDFIKDAVMTVFVLVPLFVILIVLMIVFGIVISIAVGVHYIVDKFFPMVKK